jgi:mRNA interferase RelE/StbE
MASVLVSPDVQRQIDRLPRVIRARIWQLIRRLGKWPEISGAKPLRRSLAGRYRLRTGDYRLQFRIEGDNVVIERIGHRAGFYEEQED